MPKTFTNIQSQTLQSATSTVTFSSIPNTFTDLILLNQIQHTTTSRTASIRLNGDTGTNYSYTFLTGNGSTVTGSRVTNDQWLNIAVNGSNASQIVNNLIQFMSYSNTSINKTILTSWNNNEVEVLRHVGLWRSTSAINSITIISNGTMAAGSIFKLYGIKAA